MPFTVLAHQAPLFPIRRLWRDVDSVAFVVGTVVPDLSAVTLNTTPRFFLGEGLWRDGHRWDNQLSWSLPVGLLLVFLVRRLLAPQLGRVLPGFGDWNLRSLANVSRYRKRWWVIVTSLLLGSATHLALDDLTHEREGAVVLQLGITLLLSGYTLWECRVLSRRCWELGDAPPRIEHRWVAAARRVIGVMAVAAAIFSVTQTDRGMKIVLMTWAWLMLIGCVPVALGLRRLDRNAVPVI